jgi:hypothetical protein
MSGPRIADECRKTPAERTDIRDVARPARWRKVRASQLRDYLQHRTTRASLVDWAERAMMEEEFDEGDLDTIRDITSRLGLADVREFGLTSEDCEGFLSRLGYRTTVDVVQVS